MQNDRTLTGFMALSALLAVGCSERPKPVPAAPPPPPPPSAYAYVTNEDSHDLTIINADNDSVIGTIPVGTRPRGVKAKPGWQVRVRGTERFTQVSADNARQGV
jgi:YVTN family beta-propeller protein